MSELFKIFLTSSLTVISGIIIFALGQIIVKFIIEPLHEQSKLIGEIANSLIFYGNVGLGMEPYYYQKLKGANELEAPLRKIVTERYEQIIRDQWKKSDEATELLRQQASELMGKTHAIPLYRLWAVLGVAPKLEDIIQASTQLVWMSNSTHEDGSHTLRITEIARHLNIKVVSKRFDNG